ncbi:MAG: copper-containing nitrite reductase [Halobacteriales archaeon]|nr:copper-containing nitrite reductase [Halobacteriales archaeon]
MTHTTRRSWLQALGIGGTAALAGCTAPTNDREAMRQRQAVEQAETPVVPSVAASPLDIPGPVSRSSPAEVDVTLRPEEVTAEIDDGVSFDFMTYNGQIPGPLIRVREGDTVNLTFENPDENVLPHNVDFHAVAGPGGGAGATLTNPGETTKLRFKATYPGAYLYHCAVPNLDMHISAGMFGVILVEPEAGLPEVDHEFYFGQHEVYTTKPQEGGKVRFDMTTMRREDPMYVLINGSAYAITPDREGSPSVSVGDTARVIFGVGGPNLTSNFHPIGNVWEEYYPQGSLTADPLTHIQTWPVPPGSTAIATMQFQVPGPVKLVDHALSRVAKKGCMAIISAEGPENPDIFDPNPA